FNTDLRTITPFDRYFTTSLGGAGSGDTVKLTASPPALGSATTVNALLLNGDAITISGAFNLNLGSGALLTTGATSTGDTISTAIPNFSNGTTAAEGIIYDNTGSTLTINSAIPSTSSAGLTISGGGTLNL